MIPSGLTKIMTKQVPRGPKHALFKESLNKHFSRLKSWWTTRGPFGSHKITSPQVQHEAKVSLMESYTIDLMFMPME